MINNAVCHDIHHMKGLPAFHSKKHRHGMACHEEFRRNPSEDERGYGQESWAEFQ